MDLAVLFLGLLAWWQVLVPAWGLGHQIGVIGVWVWIIIWALLSFGGFTIIKKNQQ